MKREGNNPIRAARLGRGLSQAELADASGVTRQAIYAIEGSRYLPNVAVALRLARILGKRVEELFGGEPASSSFLEGELLGGTRRRPINPRAKVWTIGSRNFVLPIARLGADLQHSTAADGLIVGRVGPDPGDRRAGRVRVELLQDPAVLRSQIVVAGCDPAIHLVAERVRGHGDATTVLGWPMGSTAAAEALKRGEVHIAGIHLVDPASGESNVAFARRHFEDGTVTLVTFASWDAGFLVGRGNPKAIHGPGDLSRRDVRLVNREPGAGARLLLDYRLKAEGVPSSRVRGYNDLVGSHFEVGRRILEGAADVGVGVETIARLFDLDFIPLQTERYDLIVPTALLTDHPGTKRLLDVLVSGPVRADLEALGGYSTRDTGRFVELHPLTAPRKRHKRSVLKTHKVSLN